MHRAVTAILMVIVAAPSWSAIESLPPPTATPERGFRDGPFEVTLSTNVAGAAIVFTTDGSPPNAAHGTAYSGPIPITTTTVLRAVTVIPQQAASRVATHTYVFLDDVIQQPAVVPGYNPLTLYPTSSIASFPVLHDNEMDPEVTGDPAYSGQMRAALTSIPTMSLAVEPSRVFGADGFNDTFDVEVPVSVEMLYPAEPERNEQIDAGIEGHAKIKNKRAFRLSFRGRYGEPKWRTTAFGDSPLSGDTAATELDRLILRSGNNRSWSMNYAPPTYTEDQFYRESQVAMSGHGARGIFAHLLINGLYWGLYNPAERPNEDFMEAYFGGDSDEYISISHSGVKDGNPDRWYELTREIVTLDMEVPANLSLLGQYLELTQFADYMILNWYVGQGDWPRNNWWAGQRYSPGGPARFIAWDGEYSWSHIGAQRPDGTGAFLRPDWTSGSTLENPLVMLWHALRTVPEFMTLFYDRIYHHVANGGALAEENNLARFAALNDWIEEAVIAESARWGDSLEPLGKPLRTRDADWNAEVELIESLMVGNTARFLALMRGICRAEVCYYPSIDPPDFKHGGLITPGFQLTMTDPNPVGNRTLYYTTDGSDPRQPGGAVSGAAQIYGGPVTLGGPTTIKARFRQSGEWSAVHAAAFVTELEPPLATLRVSELMYHPPVGTGGFNGDEYEFVELINTGDDPVELTPLRFTAGIFFDFATSAIASLDPGERLVLVSNAAAFADRYGAGPFPIAGEYSGQLNNGGEGVALIDDRSRVVHSFVYSDLWHPSTDGGGFSMVIVDPDAPESAWSEADGWRSGDVPLGTPGAAEPPDPALSVEDVAVVEGHSGSVTARFTVRLSAAAGQTVTAAFATSDGSALAGEDYVARSGNVSLAPGELSDSIAVTVLGDTLQEGDETFRVVLSNPAGAPLARAEATATVFNDDPLPPVPRLVVTELMYHPRPGPGTFPTEDYEFLELTNVDDRAADLRGVHFDAGIVFDFDDTAVTFLGPDESTVLVRNLAAFVERYGDDHPIAGAYTGQLSNAGDRLVLLDRFGRVIQEFRYDDFWQPETDGGGFSLSILDPEGDDHAWDDDDSWSASRLRDGTPGWVERPGVASPPPGSVYREFAVAFPSSDWRVTDPFSRGDGLAYLPNPTLALSIPPGQLADAISAELLIDYWAGDPGAALARFRFNGNGYLTIPSLTTTPAGDSSLAPTCFVSQYNPVVRVPLAHLQEGTNLLEGTASNQTCGHLVWGQWGWPGVILRVYYDPEEVAAPSGRITSPLSRTTIGEDPVVRISASGGGGIAEVVVLARTEAYDVDGDGIWQDFQQAYHLEPGDEELTISHHVGSSSTFPFSVTWDTSRVPGQPAGGIQLIARVRGAGGLWRVTEVVDRLSLVRERPLKLLPATFVPPGFHVSAAEPVLTSQISIPPTVDLARVAHAELVVRTWNGRDAGAGPTEQHYTAVNGWTIPDAYGQDDHHSLDALTVPVEQLQPGDNTVEFGSQSTGYGIDVLWPGPGLLLEFDGPVAAFCGDARLDPGEECDDGNVDEGDACHADCTLPPSTVRLPALYAFEGDTQTVLDVSGNDNQGVLEAGAVRDPAGRFGQAIRFDGDGGRVNLGGLDVAGNRITLALWFKADDFDVNDGRLLSKAVGTATQDHYWMLSTRLQNGAVRLRFRLKTTSGGTATVVGNAVVPAGTWVHAAATYDGARLRLYQDGALVGNIAKVGEIVTDPAVPAWIGENPGGGKPFDGLVDEVHILADVLSPTEIQQLMETPLALVGSCGDGILDPGEECDDGNLSDLDVCQSDCRYARCDDCSQFELTLFFNGESCGLAVCDSTTGYTVDGIVEFSAGDLTAQLVDGARVSTRGALFGERGLESATSFDEMLFAVSDGDLVPLDAATVCMIVRREGPVPESGYRLFEARAFDNGSLVRIDFSGSDDLRLTYRDGSGMTRAIVTSWGGADSSDALLIEAAWDSTVSHHGLRLAVDGVERAVDPAPLEPLARIGELRIGNGTANAGSFAIDPVMISALGRLDCWAALSGRCGTEPLEPCIDDGDCAPGDGCLGVTEEPWQLTDTCPDDPEKVEPAVCGCGNAEDDIDADREVDCVDACIDADGDGYGSPGGGGDACLGSDCADADPTIHPGVAEITCDGIDNDCNVKTADRPDTDGDGYACEADCDDANAAVNTGTVERTCDGIDNDCDPSTVDDVDLDGDQFACSLDCDDTDPAVHPAALEQVCDGIDNDCDPATPDLLDDEGHAFVSLVMDPGSIGWAAQVGAEAYDVVRGDLLVLRDTAGDFAQATTACVVDDLPHTTLAVADTPPPGAALWYLVRPVGVTGGAGYDTCDLVEGRDPEIAASGADCP